MASLAMTKLGRYSMLLMPYGVPGANAASVPVAPPVPATTNVSEKEVDTPTTALENNGAVDGVNADDDCSEDDDDTDVMAVAITYLEEDCRLLRAQK